MSKSEAYERVKDIFIGIIQDLPASFSDEHSLIELGGTSMDMLKLQMELRRAFGKKISIETLYEIGSVAGIAERVVE